MRLPSRPVLVLGVVAAWLLFGRRARAAPAPTPGGSGADIIEAETTASFYGGSFFEGKLTASGEPFVSSRLTAAMRTPMPFGTMVRVTDLDTGRSVVVRVNDRGPFAKRADGSFSRSIDLSVGSAAAIGLDIQRGLARVRLERV